jgi:hypothetical protein
MKCIKEVGTGKVLRVKDADARTKVGTGKFAYCPKSEWKAQTRKTEVTVVAETDETEVKVHGLKAKERRTANKK